MIGISSIITIAAVNTFFVKSADKQHSKSPTTSKTIDSKKQVGNILSYVTSAHSLEGQERCEDTSLINSMVQLKLERRKESEDVNVEKSNQFLSENMDIDEQTDTASLRKDAKSLGLYVDESTISAVSEPVVRPKVFRSSDMQKNTHIPSPLPKTEYTNSTQFLFIDNRLILTALQSNFHSEHKQFIMELWERMLVVEINQIFQRYESLPQINLSAMNQYLYTKEKTDNLLDEGVLRYITQAFTPEMLNTDHFIQMQEEMFWLPRDLYVLLSQDVKMIINAKPGRILTLEIIRREVEEFYTQLASMLLKSNKIWEDGEIQLTFEDFRELAEDLDDKPKKMITQVLKIKQQELFAFQYLYLSIRHISDKLSALNEYPGFPNISFITTNFEINDLKDEETVVKKRLEKLRNTIQFLKEKSDPNTIAELGLFLFNCAQLKDFSDKRLALRIEQIKTSNCAEIVPR